MYHDHYRTAMTETSKHDPGWWQHILGSLVMGAFILLLYHFKASEAWVFTLCLALIWPIREFVQNGTGMIYGRSFWEWMPPASIIIASDIAGRYFS